MRMKVGLLTTDSTPRPSATPFASCVLPAPNGPISANTVPGVAARPRVRPTARVSDALWVVIMPPTAGGVLDRVTLARIRSLGVLHRQGGLQVSQRNRRQPTVLEADQPHPRGDAR